MQGSRFTSLYKQLWLSGYPRVTKILRSDDEFALMSGLNSLRILIVQNLYSLRSSNVQQRF